MAKTKIAAPIDRPLSRAYLRNFSGWSTAYPPGASEPTSFRVMENVFIERDGAVRIRPGMRKVLSSTVDRRFIGSFEPFIDSGGGTAYLIAEWRPGLSSPKVYITSFSKASSDLFRSSAPSPDRPIDLEELSPHTTYVNYVQIDNKIVALVNAPGETDPQKASPLIYYVGSNTFMRRPQQLTGGPREVYRFEDQGLLVGVAHPDFSAPSDITATNDIVLTTFTEDTLVSSDGTKNEYNYGFFSTFSNEFGETPPSAMTILRAQRPHGQWVVTKGGLPSTPERADDRILITWGAAAAHLANFWSLNTNKGATHFNVYCAMWSDDGVVPTEGVLVGRSEIQYPAELENRTGTVVNAQGYVIMTGSAPGSETHPIPAPHMYSDPRQNYSTPGQPANALVSADRIVYVNDRSRPGVIRWSSGLTGEYLNTSPSKGGGFKTLTSGNMQIPATVKMWQNPQSVDSLTILNLGTDGYSTSLYMAPAEVSGQTASTPIMGFETVSGTPGTTSPFAVETFNNALYHPQPDQLMKTTANNYNINHKTLTEDIKNQWLNLTNREMMVSAEFDGRLYYIVTPEGSTGTPLSEHCNGTEIWVYDALSENGSWSRWTIPAISLRKMELGGKLYMAVVRPEGIYLLDEAYSRDDFHPHSYPELVEGRPIRWKFETNTQGANRAHDAWAHLKQLVLTAGTFTGKMRYGIRGLDRHGQRIQKSKVFESPMAYVPSPREVPFDLEDALQVGKDMKEWFFHASSYEDKDGVVAHSRGRINSLQYRYTPVSVNVHGEEGSVETFEYGNSNNSPQSRTSNSGLTRPMYGPTASADTFQVAPQPE